MQGMRYQITMRPEFTIYVEDRIEEQDRIREKSMTEFLSELSTVGAQNRNS